MNVPRLLAIFLCSIALAFGTAACEPAEPDATLAIGYEAHGAYADPLNFRAQIFQSGGVRMIEGTDLTVKSRSSDYFSGSLESLSLDAGKEATVRISMITVAALPVEVTYSWVPQKDDEHGLWAVVRTERPLGFCINLIGAVALPPRAATSGDSLFVLHSALPKGAIC